MTPVSRSHEKNHALGHNLGLTLVEMIAALIILSSATTAGIGILQSASSSVREATQRLDAVDVYERWRQHEALNPVATLPWRWIDERDVLWTVADAGSRAAGALTTANPATTSPQTQTVPQAALQWRTVTISFEDETGSRIAVSFERLELIPAPASQPGLLIDGGAP